MSFRGHIDCLTREGLLEGWCWEEGNVDRRVEVTVLVDGLAVCSGVAGLFRADIFEAGIGDGFHAFAIFLPWDRISGRRSRTITLLDTLTGKLLEQKLVYHDFDAIDLDERLCGLEAKARQIQTQLSDTSELLRRANAAGDLFAVVGAFFCQLAENATRGLPLTNTLSLSNVVEAAMATYPVLTLQAGNAPRVTICIEGHAPLATLYRCIDALVRAGAERSAELVLLDLGRFDDVPIIPTVVRGLLYRRLFGSFVAEWNEVARSALAEVVVFLSGQAEVEPDWLDEVLDAFKRSPTLGALGGCVIDADGLPLHGGLMLRNGRLLDCAARQGSADPGLPRLRWVHALSHQAIAIRREALSGCGYLDEVYVTPAATILDLCTRLAKAGWLIGYLPSARHRWLPCAEGPGAWSLSRIDGANGETGDLQRLRLQLPCELAPDLASGTIAIIGSADEDAGRLLTMAQQLYDGGYGVWYLGPVEAESDLARELGRRGSETVTCNNEGAVSAALVAIKPDLIYHSRELASISRGQLAAVIARDASAAMSLTVEADVPDRVL